MYVFICMFSTICIHVYLNCPFFIKMSTVVCIQAYVLISPVFIYMYSTVLYSCISPQLSCIHIYICTYVHVTVLYLYISPQRSFFHIIDLSSAVLFSYVCPQRSCLCPQLFVFTYITVCIRGYVLSCPVFM
jgi:hypothetical protein